MSKKIDAVLQNIKESNTIDKKHKEITKNFQSERDNSEELDKNIEMINEKLNEMEKSRDKFTIEELKSRAKLLDEKEELEKKI